MKPSYALGLIPQNLYFFFKKKKKNLPLTNEGIFEGYRMGTGGAGGSLRRGKTSHPHVDEAMDVLDIGNLPYNWNSFSRHPRFGGYIYSRYASLAFSIG
jgi:hypothetical protein